MIAMKTINVFGEPYEIKENTEWTLGDYAEVMDASTVVDPVTIETRQLRGTDMIMMIMRGVIKPKLDENLVKAMPPVKAQKLYTAIIQEMMTPLSEEQS